MRNIGLVALLCVFSTVAVAELTEKIQKKLDTAEATYKAAVDKADNVRFYAVQKATGDRVKALKMLMTEATKAGDLDGATEIKARIAVAEAAGGLRTKPQDMVKFNGHSYALINEKVTWHTARRNCEAMSGHLVAIESLEEQVFVLGACRKANTEVWIGLSNEENLKWAWVTGEPAQLNEAYRLDDPNREKLAGAMMFFPGYGTFTDWNLGAYNGYICEWEK